MPSTSLLYELGRSTHREDDYRIILSAIWQNVLRSNQRPKIALKTLMLLEAVLLHGGRPSQYPYGHTGFVSIVMPMRSASAHDAHRAATTNYQKKTRRPFTILLLYKSSTINIPPQDSRRPRPRA